MPSYFDSGTRSALLAGISPFGLANPDVFADQLDRYGALLETWGARINLTAIREPAEVAEKHFVDCLHVLPHLPAAAATKRVVDAGAGAGFPGLVLALARRDLHFDLVEPSHKRVAFLRTVVRELALANVQVHSVRAEEHLADRKFQPYDVAVSRATWKLPEWLELGTRFVQPGGLVIGMEGSETHALPPAAVRFTYALGPAQRSLILLPL